MYRALVTANNLAIIGKEARWDDGLTKTEALELLVNTYEAYIKQNGYITDAKQGSSEGKIIIDVVEETEITTGGTMTGDSIELDDGEKEIKK